VDGRDGTARETEDDIDAGIGQHLHEQVGAAAHRLGRLDHGGRGELVLGVDELREIERLRDRALRTGFARRDLEIRGHRGAREHDVDVLRRGVRLDAAARLDAIEAGHVDVHHDEVGLDRADLQHRVDRVVDDGDHEIAAIAKAALRRAELEIVVVDDQHADRTDGGSACSGRA